MAKNEVSDLSELEQKKLFAKALMKFPDDPFSAAKQVFGLDTNKALSVYLKWPKDIDVLAFRAELMEVNGGVDRELPTKQKIASDVYQLSSDSSYSFDDRLKAYSLVCKILGYLDDSAKVNVQNNNITNKVMVMRDHGSDEDWETKLMEQQRQLIAESERDDEQ